MLFISEAESAGLVTHALAYAATKEALMAACEGATSFPAVLGHGSDKANRFSVKAASTSDVAGLKVGSYWPGNTERGLARHNSLILLFDQAVGRISVAMEAGIVNAYRTAAADAVAADLLAAPDAGTLAIFGAGNQAAFEVAAVSRIRPIRRVLVVARDAGKGAAFAEKLRSETLEVTLTDARTACQEAAIIIAATPSRAPLFEAGWVRPGTHVASMGSDAPGKQELPPALLARARLFCDLPEQSRRIGELQHAPAEASLTAIGDVLAGRAQGRRDAGEITIFDSSGLSLQDLVIARHILAAREAAA